MRMLLGSVTWFMSSCADSRLTVLQGTFSVTPAVVQLHRLDASDNDQAYAVLHSLSLGASKGRPSRTATARNYSSWVASSGSRQHSGAHLTIWDAACIDMTVCQCIIDMSLPTSKLIFHCSDHNKCTANLMAVAMTWPAARSECT